MCLDIYYNGDIIKLEVEYLNSRGGYMKKILACIYLLILSVSLIRPVNADMFSKPTSDVQIIGLDQKYSFDLLRKYDKSKVKFLTEAEVLERTENDYYLDVYPEALNGYYDNDGFASYSLYTSIPHSIRQVEDHNFHCGYFSPPDVFKIALVLDTGEIIVSDIIHKTIFYAHFTFDLSHFSLAENESEIISGRTVYTVTSSLSETMPYKQMVSQISIAVFVTVILELLVLFAFLYKKLGSFKLVIITNLVTQAVLHTSVILGYWLADFIGLFGILIIGEIIVFATEIIVYRKYLKEQSKQKATLYAIISNFVSLGIGILGLSWLISFFT